MTPSLELLILGLSVAFNAGLHLATVKFQAETIKETKETVAGLDKDMSVAAERLHFTRWAAHR